ncbi:MAG: helix-turn-helix transcriptional regulator [Candidatus Omnitrophica bacterium]|nr:helix-turn-helix transcriptional regulator [Candidatus Omnitrophota bacterium]
MGFDALNLNNKNIARRDKEFEKIKIKYERTRHDLGERVKELHCMYGIMQLIEKYESSIDKVLQGAAELIPPSWQYPAVTCACISYSDRTYCTKKFRKSKWKQSADIYADKQKVGSVDVYYSKNMPQSDEGPFLKEERALIEDIANRLGSFIGRKYALRMLTESQKLLEQKNNDLNKKNIALKELVAQFEIEKRNLAKKVSVNAQRLLLPLIERLAMLNVPKEYVKALEDSVNQIASEFGPIITHSKFRLSAREIEVSNMIKSGLSSKQIAQILSLSFQTIEAYRKNIRKKLGLTQQRINLAAYLKEL